MELSLDVNHRPIIFIRFNPDDYIDQNEINITSCWYNNQKGICTNKKSKTKEWDERIAILNEQIRYWTTHETNKKQIWNSWKTLKSRNHV
mgnify:CR=1 FL=1